MSYYDNVMGTLASANKRSFNYATSHREQPEKGCGKAWDNVKAKNCQRYLPRGKAFTKMRQIQLDAMATEIGSLTASLKGFLAKKLSVELEEVEAKLAKARGESNER